VNRRMQAVVLMDADIPRQAHGGQRATFGN